MWERMIYVSLVSRYVIMETTLSRQLFAPVLPTNQLAHYSWENKPKNTKYTQLKTTLNTNNLALVKT